MTQATQADYQQLDDPEFFAERRRVREQLERLPWQHTGRCSLTEQSQQLDEEFLRRAREAWSGPETERAVQ
jgi:hypothetical protein